MSPVIAQTWKSELAAVFARLAVWCFLLFRKGRRQAKTGRKAETAQTKATCGQRGLRQALAAGPDPLLFTAGVDKRMKNWQSHEVNASFLELCAHDKKGSKPALWVYRIYR